MLFDFAETEPALRYKLMSQTIVPRPIAWIVTEDRTLNIAPFSFFSGIASEPPTVMVAIGHKKDGSPKDTLHNLRMTKKCVICSVTPDALQKMHFSSAELSADQNEAEKFEIETVKILEDYPPMIKGAPTALFCTLSQEVILDGSKTIPLFLQIEHMHLDDKLNSEESTFELDLIARTGKAYRELGKITKPPVIPS